MTEDRGITSDVDVSFNTQLMPRHELEKHYLSAWQLVKFAVPIVVTLTGLFWYIADLKVNAALKELYQDIYSSQMKELQERIDQLEKKNNTSNPSAAQTPQASKIK